MKTQITIARQKTNLLKSLDTGTVFLHTELDGKTPALWMVTDAKPPYDGYIMCVNLKSGRMIDYDRDIHVRVDLNAQVNADFA